MNDSNNPKADWPGNHRQDSSTAIVKLRVRPRQKSAWVKAAQKSKSNLSGWLASVADAEAAKHGYG